MALTFDKLGVILCQAYVAALLFLTGATLYGPDRWWWEDLPCISLSGYGRCQHRCFFL